MAGTADEDGLAGRRLVVVGASSGIGRAVARAAAARGAAVGLVARRRGLLADLQREIADAGGRGRSSVLPCDVCSAIAIDFMAGAAVQQLGGIDAVVYATGVNRLALLEDTTPELWRELFETNVIGASLVTRAMLPALRRAEGVRPRVAFLSSHSVPRPWPALGAYAASKAALESMVVSWRTEVPDVAFGRVVVGPTMTGMADAWDPEAAAAMFARWAELGLLGEHEPVPPAVVADAVIGWLEDPEPPEDLRLV